jgi:hypothetical protein
VVVVVLVGVEVVTVVVVIASVVVVVVDTVVLVDVVGGRVVVVVLDVVPGGWVVLVVVVVTVGAKTLCQYVRAPGLEATATSPVLAPTFCLVPVGLLMSVTLLLCRNAVPVPVGKEIELMLLDL